MHSSSFYLGSHLPNWLETATFPLFVSHRRLAARKSLPTANVTWCLDSGGFTELSMHGRWVTSAVDYVRSVQRYRNEIGNLMWASPQDAMCEPWILDNAKAWLGGTVQAHQQWTVDNFVQLRTLDASIPFIPVLQGWQLDDYVRHLEMYDRAGIDLRQYETVGVGSVCRRQATNEIGAIFERLHQDGLRMHGFGVKVAGIRKYGKFLSSADSMAWSFGGRKQRPCPVRGVSSCANCYHYAERWRETIIGVLSRPSHHQQTLDVTTATSVGTRTPT